MVECQALPRLSASFVNVVLFQFLAMMAFRVFRNDNKSNVKLLHMTIQAAAFAFGVLGLKAVFDFHNHNDIPNMYSLHSWIGITAFVLFACQVINILYNL